MRETKVKEIIIKTTDREVYQYFDALTIATDAFLTVRISKGKYKDYKICFPLNSVLSFSFLLDESEDEP